MFLVPQGAVGKNHLVYLHTESPGDGIGEGHRLFLAEFPVTGGIQIQVLVFQGLVQVDAGEVLGEKAHLQAPDGFCSHILELHQGQDAAGLVVFQKGTGQDHHRRAGLIQVFRQGKQSGIAFAHGRSLSFGIGCFEDMECKIIEQKDCDQK